ncbi:MAG: nitrile hydratase accessory protein [Rhodospirillaceae bacterium TMED8]|nr:nitrile hydratase accessory protein [Magnetovibrio sp.]OUT51676.1 MAG: nitrile hydratase accessory protein [Rhodospirillaceae bacterium TMED8]|tara:strand:- start:2797 stop:3162 length:366 start_codon:yes stop_codon:yes gene_type:complete
MKKNLPLLRLQPYDQDGPVFGAPWHAVAFALAVQLSENGLFSWPEFTQVMSEEIKKAQDSGDLDLGETYYDHWLCALERMVKERGVTDSQTLIQRKKEWRLAYLHTTHDHHVPFKSSLFER